MWNISYRISGLIILCLYLFAVVDCRHEIDVSWDFERGLEGWANSTSEEMQMQVLATQGELRAHIVGHQPHMDSPSMYLLTTSRHFVIFRMMYVGESSTAQLLLRTGPEPSRVFQLDQTTTNWNKNAPVVPISGSQAINASHGLGHLADSNPYSTYVTTASSGVTVVFDLSNYRWITSFTLHPIGNTMSPKHCLLQKSASSGIGPFLTVASFTVPMTGGSGNQIVPFTVSGFGDYSRYWRLYILDNYGGAGIGIREISVEGYDESVTAVPFSIDNKGKYGIYYIPIYDHMVGPLLRMRLELLPPPRNVSSVNGMSVSTSFRQALSADFIAIGRAPDIWRVRGCLNKYYEEEGFLHPQYNTTNMAEVVNNALAIRYFEQNEMDLQFASTYDCPLKGGIPITVEGLNFGATARVFVGGSECPVMSYGLAAEGGRVDSIICTLPPGQSGTQNVRVENGALPGMFQELPALAYRTAPPVPLAPIVTNIGAHRVDLVWSPPGDVFDAMITTGYKILWFRPKFRSQVSNITVGNVTTTSIRGLTPGTEYIFAIAGMAEGATNEKSAFLPTDLYGRRSPTADALIGTFSSFTNVTGTLDNDFDFNFFNANMTLNASSISVASRGPTGNWGGEGSYGLVLVGSANVENCNVSSTCCDGYNATIGLASCGLLPSVCAVLPARMLEYEYVIGGVTRRQTPQNIPYESGGLPEINIFTLAELIGNKGADLPAARCGPSLRLTASEARASGAAWYRRKMDVREGFDTTITFEISNPSFHCSRMNDVNTYCRSRGADGLAFVLQNVAPNALGVSGSGLGYEGIFNSLAVEIDTFMNYDNLDFYENHISVMTQGFRYNISANHSKSLATTTRIPDLTDGKHTIRIRYDPNFLETAVPHPSFQTNGYTSEFLTNADYFYGGEGDWGAGFGLLYVYLDDLYSPVITTPLNLGATLQLDSGRAYVGITAATGDNDWQVHDIQSWQFRSLHIDELYHPPVTVNGVGDFQCVNMSVCVHYTDYLHYNRQQNVWKP